MAKKRRYRGKDGGGKRDDASAQGRKGGDNNDDRDKNRWKGDGGKPWAKTFVLRSRPFEAYYQAMGIMTKEEWPVFMKTLKDPLPACFRIHSDCSFKDEVKKQLMKLLEAPMVIEGKEVKAVRELPWYAGGLAYRLGCDRRFIRKQPHLAEFHVWLTNLMESGNITRQEAVSMLPPLFLDVQPKHLVLDMCAAPGSKTAQLMEMVSAPSPAAAAAAAAATTAAEEGGGRNEEEVGLVVANDSDRDRAYMLAHQCKRVKSPAICITWCPAQSLPNLGAAGSERGSDKGVFDRVLADVPCSGDGTLRKQPSIWRTWTVAGGLGLHPLQLLITLRGAAMLKIGGKMVYSTCSLNPIEDEAVVAEVLRRSGGNLELEDCHSMLPGLKTRPGLHTWPVLTGTARFKGVKTPRGGKGDPCPSAAPTATAANGDADTCGPQVAVAADGGEGQKKKEGTGVAMDMGGEGGPAAAAAAADADAQEGEAPAGNVAEGAASAAAVAGEGADGAQKVEGAGQDQFPEPAVASEAPLEDAIKAGLRHHPSFAEVDTATSRKMIPSFFPPSVETARALKLERCMRMLPQDQDTGGFFVAVLVKTGPILWQDLISPGENLAGDDEGTSTPATPAANATPAETPASEQPPAAPDAATTATTATDSTSSEVAAVPPAPTGEPAAAASEAAPATDDKEGSTDVGGKADDAKASRGGRGAARGWGDRGRGARGRGRGRGRGRMNASRPQDAEREEYVPLEEGQWPQIKMWFGMREDFPVERLYTRKAGSRAISYVAPATKRFLLDDPAGSRLQMVHTGVKVFERNSQARCTIEYRVCQEGLDLVLPYMTKRVTRRASAADISRALDGIAVPVSSLSPPVQADLQGQEEGIFVLVHTVEATGKVFTACVWKGRAENVSSMINKDLLTGMRLEMKSLGVFVPKPEEPAAPTATTTTTAPVEELPSAAATAAVADASGSTASGAATATQIGDEIADDIAAAEAPAATE